MLNQWQPKRTGTNERVAEEGRIRNRAPVVTEGNGAGGGELSHWRESDACAAERCGGDRHQRQAER